MVPNKTRLNNWLPKIFIKIANKSCNKGLKYWKFMRKRNKAKQVMKKIILKGNTAPKYFECKHIKHWYQQLEVHLHIQITVF